MFLFLPDSYNLYFFERQVYCLWQFRACVPVYRTLILTCFVIHALKKNEKEKYHLWLVFSSWLLLFSNCNTRRIVFLQYSAIVSAIKIFLTLQPLVCPSHSSSPPTITLVATSQVVPRPSTSPSYPSRNTGCLTTLSVISFSYLIITCGHSSVTVWLMASSIVFLPAYLVPVTTPEQVNKERHL